jgi:chromosome segregation ATPase
LQPKSGGNSSPPSRMGSPCQRKMNQDFKDALAEYSKTITELNTELNAKDAEISRLEGEVEELSAEIKRYRLSSHSLLGIIPDDKNGGLVYYSDIQAATHQLKSELFQALLGIHPAQKTKDEALMELGEQLTAAKEKNILLSASLRQSEGRIADLESDLRVNASMLAKQCDLARDAEQRAETAERQNAELKLKIQKAIIRLEDIHDHTIGKSEDTFHQIHEIEGASQENLVGIFKDLMSRFR